MALTLPLNTETMYVDNNARQFMLVNKNEDKAHLWSQQVDLWFEIRTGIAPGTECKIVDQLPPPRLPLIAGRKYVTNEGDEITLYNDGHCSPKSLRSNETKLYFHLDTGKAPSTHVYVVAELPLDEAAELGLQREAMMKRLKEMGAC